MRKILFFMAFTILSIVVLPYNVESFKEIIANSKVIEKSDKVDYLEDRIVITGAVIRGFRIDRIETDTVGDSKVIITKTDLISSFMKKNRDVKNMEVELDTVKNRVVTRGQIPFLGFMIGVEIDGAFLLNEKGEINYDISRASLGIIPVPDGTIRDFKERINPVFMLKELEIPLFVTQILLEKDKIIIK